MGKKSIRLKMLIGFFFPCIFVILLGGITYKKASDAIMNNYEIAMKNTVDKTAEYYELMIDNLSIKINQIAINNTIRNYYRGTFSENGLEEKTQFNSIMIMQKYKNIVMLHKNISILLYNI